MILEMNDKLFRIIVKFPKAYNVKTILNVANYKYLPKLDQNAVRL